MSMVNLWGPSNWQWCSPLPYRAMDQIWKVKLHRQMRVKAKIPLWWWTSNKEDEVQTLFFFFLVGSTSFPEKCKRPTPEELGSMERPINVDNFQIIGDQIIEVINLTRDMVSLFQLNFILHITHLCRRTCVPQTCLFAVHWLQRPLGIFIHCMTHLGTPFSTNLLSMWASESHWTTFSFTPC